MVAIFEDGPAKGAALVFRADAGGGTLSIKAAPNCTSNKKVPPRTMLWKVPEVKLVEGERADARMGLNGNPKKHIVWNAMKKPSPPWRISSLPQAPRVSTATRPSSHLALILRHCR